MDKILPCLNQVDAISEKIELQEKKLDKFQDQLEESVIKNPPPPHTHTQTPYPSVLNNVEELTRLISNFLICFLRASLKKLYYINYSLGNPALVGNKVYFI